MDVEKMMCWEMVTQTRRIGETASGRDGKASLWLPGHVQVTAYHRCQPRSRRAGSEDGMAEGSNAAQHSAQEEDAHVQTRISRQAQAFPRPPKSQMRVVESGVSVTATPSANQGARVNVRVPTQLSPFLPAMASHGVLVRQGLVVVTGEVDAGNRCWAEFSNYWGFQHAMLTPGRAIAMSTTAASRVKSEDGVLGTLQAADPRVREYRVEQRGRFAPLPRTRSPPPRLHLTWRGGEVDGEISPSIVSTGSIPTTLDLGQTLGAWERETLVDLFFSSTLGGKPPSPRPGRKHHLAPFPANGSRATPMQP